MRGRVLEILLSLSAIVLVTTALACVDGRVRERALALAESVASPSGLASAALYARDAARIFMTAVADLSLAHAPLVVLATAAAILVVVMLRT